METGVVRDSVTDEQAIRSISSPSYPIMHRELMNAKGPKAEALQHVSIINLEPVQVGGIEVE